MSQTAHTRETRAGASELKFLVPTHVGRQIEEWARARLPADPHGSGPFGDEYRITSLYFDTDQHDVFHARRSFGRCKYRVRRYGASDMVFLERKLRKPGLLHKRRTLMGMADLDRLDHGELGEKWPGRWFHRRILARRLRPVCELSYRRMARTLEHDDAHIRLTMDDDLRARAVVEFGFGTDQGAAVLDRQMVLELKFRHELPAMFQLLIDTFGLTPMATSKYRLGMTALGHVMLPEPTAAGAPP